MNPLSDCHHASPASGLTPHCTPGKAFGLCSECLQVAVFDTPIDPPTPRRSKAPLAIILGLLCAAVAGMLVHQGKMLPGLSCLAASVGLGVAVWRRNDQCPSVGATETKP
jgi:hypothetical protein